MASAAFGTVARTVVIRDNEGEITFTFDIEDADASQLVLEHHERPAISRRRYLTGFESARKFLQEAGFIVSEHGKPRFADEVDGTLIAELLERAVGDVPAAVRERASADGVFHQVPQCLSINDESGSPWRLWFVYRRHAGRVSVVYEPLSKQFGVVQEGLFLGFWGSLEQTLEAVSGA